MNRLKIVSVMIAAMFFCLAVTSTGSALPEEDQELDTHIENDTVPPTHIENDESPPTHIEKEDGYTGAYLAGSIDVNISGWIGLVTPKMNFTEEQVNQSISLYVNTSEEGKYKVEDKIRIKLNIIHDSVRNFFLTRRSMMYRVVMVRKFKDIPTKPLFGILRRTRPVRTTDSVCVVPGLLHKKTSDNITIEINKNYPLKGEDCLKKGYTENVTLKLYAMGFYLPGDVEGFILKKLPIIDHITLNLKISYYNDTATSIV